jgi:dipicolinate synthase subunit B
MDNPIKVGFAFCGSFCTFDRVIAVLEGMAGHGYDVFPIMSETAANTDTRFGSAASFRERITQACGHAIIASIHDAEPIGPQKLLDVLVVAPCTGNTLGKLAAGIADSAVTLGNMETGHAWTVQSQTWGVSGG